MAFPVTATTNDLFVGLAKFLIGTAGAEPVNEVGYTPDGSNFTLSVPDEYAPHRVNEFDGPVAITRTTSAFKAMLDLAQFNSDTLALALGRSASGGGAVWGRGMQSPPEYSFGMIGTLKNKRPIHVRAYYGVVTSPHQIESGKAMMAGLHIEIEALDGSAPYGAVYMMGMAAATETIATGAFARNSRDGVNTITFVRMSGEGAAADALADITGADALVDGERIRLMVTNGATMPITITHATGVIELKDSANLLMDNDNDWLDLYYDATATAWKEIARNIVP